MTDLSTLDSEVANTWRLCKSVLAKHRCNLKLPKDTDPSKTYQWRYATKLTERFASWNFDYNTARTYLEIAAKHVGEAKIRKHGLSVFLQQGLMDQVYAQLTQKEQVDAAAIEVLQESKNFVESQNRGGQTLLNRINTRFNIVSWYDAGRLSIPYLALSKSCTGALHTLQSINKLERERIPSWPVLSAKRDEFLRDPDFIVQAKSVLVSDWRTW